MSKRLLQSFSIVLSMGCATHAKIGETYEQVGNLPIAIEYYAKGLEKNPADDKLRQRLIVAEQQLEWRLRDDVRRLTENQGHSTAIRKLLTLEAAAIHMKSLDLKHEDPAALNQERKEVTQVAIDHLSEELDQRLTRGQRLKSDLRACRQVSALAEDDTALKRRCDMLQNNMKLSVEFKIKRGQSALSQRVADQTRRALKSLNLDLIDVEITPENPPTGQVRVAVQPANVKSTNWVQTSRNAYRVFVEQRDREGKVKTKKQVIKPTKRQILAAKKAGNPRPKNKVITKVLYKEVSGEYTNFKKTRKVSIPYAVKLVDLRSGSEVAVTSGIAVTQSSAECHEYRGSPEAKKHRSGAGSRGCGNGGLKSQATLVNQAVNQIVGSVKKRLIKVNED